MLWDLRVGLYDVQGPRTPYSTVPLFTVLTFTLSHNTKNEIAQSAGDTHILRISAPYWHWTAHRIRIRSEVSPRTVATATARTHTTLRHTKYAHSVPARSIPSRANEYKHQTHTFARRTLAAVERPRAAHVRCRQRGVILRGVASVAAHDATGRKLHGRAERTARSWSR